MHDVQARLLATSNNHDLSVLSLRQIADLVGVRHAQTVKYHLIQLEKCGFIRLVGGKVKVLNRSQKGDSVLLSIPVLGAANCGGATRFADDRIEGYLQVSANLLREKRDIFALKAVGDSMDAANIDGRSIDDGDYVLVSTRYEQPSSGHYVLSVIGGAANIKKFLMDRENNQVVLLSESTKPHPPIFIHPEDDYRINGRVVQVLKFPKSSK